jgi:TPR repeat protein
MMCGHVMRRLLPAAALGIVVISFDAAAAGSLLRVACEGADAGAEVTINGVFKGECPLDIQVSEGTIQLRVLKKVDASRERVFEQQFRIGDGVVKKVEAVLGAPQLNPAAQRRLEAEFASLRQAAEAGDAKAMFSLAYRYEQGRGVAQSDALANDWYRKAADAGNADAMTNLGFRHQVGKGTPPDGAAAVMWYRRAAEAGNPTAMNNLAAHYLDGKSVPRDVAEAIRWFEQSAAAGYAEAAANLAFNYASGTVLPKNDALALEWYRKAAEGGSARAMYGLGTMYANGRGVARDGEEAVRWYRAAAAKSYTPAINELKKRGLQ